MKRTFVKEMKDIILSFITALAVMYVICIFWGISTTTASIILFGLACVWLTLFYAANSIGGEIDDVH